MKDKSMYFKYYFNFFRMFGIAWIHEYKIKKYSLFFISLNLIVSLITTQTGPTINLKNQTKLTMKEAVKIAIENRPSLKALQFNTQANRFAEKQAIAGYLPQIKLNNYSFYSKGVKNLENQIKLQASQLIYGFSSPIDLKKMAKKGIISSKLEEMVHRNLIQNQVENAFLHAFLEQEHQKFISALAKSSKKNIESYKYKNKLNLLNKNDWLKQKMEYSKELSVIEIYKEEKSIAQKQLERLTGKDIFSSNNNNIELEWNNKTELKKIGKLSSYIKRATTNRPEIKIYQTLIEKDQLEINHHKNSYLPSVNVQGEIIRSSSIGSTQGKYVRAQKTMANAGINLTWNLFDGAAKFHKSNEIESRKIKRIMEKESMLKQIKLEVQKAYHELLKAKNELVAKKTEFEQAQNEFELRKQELRVGKISHLTFSKASTLWEQKKFEFLATKINFSIMQNNLNFACGYDEMQ